MPPFSASEFADDTDYERFTLDRLGTHRVQIDEPTMIYHAEANPSGGTHVYVKVGAATMGGAAREDLRSSLQPLGFGAGYKVLDMLVEHVMRANGTTGTRIPFTTKEAALRKRPGKLPVPLDGRRDLWERLAATYLAFVEARHALTHRRAQVTPSGDLEIYGQALQGPTLRKRIDTIPSGELMAFAAAVHTVAEAVIAGVTDTRRDNIAAWHLNALRARHGLRDLDATDPDAGRRLFRSDLVQLDDGSARFDVKKARQAVAQQQPPSFWDLELLLDGRTFVGRWEDLPDGTGDAVEFHPAAPPAWLAEQAL